MFTCLLSDKQSNDVEKEVKNEDSNRIYVDHPDCNSIERVIKNYYNNNGEQIPAFIKMFYEECKKK